MNRSDEIQAVARDIAQRVTCDPEQRNAMADDLIKLVSLVVAAVGKSVASAGESGLNEARGWEFELDSMSIDYSPEEEAAKEAEFAAEQREESIKCHGMYLTGERIQEGAEWVQSEACGADLERYERDGLKPVWAPQPACPGLGACTGIHNQRGEHLRDDPTPKFTGCPDPSDDGELDDGWEGPYDESFEDLYREAPNDNFDEPRCPDLSHDDPANGRCGNCGYKTRRPDGSCSWCGFLDLSVGEVHPTPKFTGCPDLLESGTACGRCAPAEFQPAPELFAPGAEAYYRKVLGLDGICDGCGHAMASHGTHLGCLIQHESGSFCTCEHNRCAVTGIGGGACVKAAGHRPPGSDDPHVFV